MGKREGVLLLGLILATVAQAIMIFRRSSRATTMLAISENDAGGAHRTRRKDGGNGEEPSTWNRRGKQLLASVHRRCYIESHDSFEDSQ